jgi:hypothetical protein
MAPDAGTRPERARGAAAVRDVAGWMSCSPTFIGVCRCPGPRQRPVCQPGRPSVLYLQRWSDALLVETEAGMPQTCQASLRGGDDRGNPVKASIDHSPV